MSGDGSRPGWADELVDVAALGVAAEERDLAEARAADDASRSAPPQPGLPGALAEEPEPRRSRLLKDNLVVAAGTALSRVTGVARLLVVWGLARDLGDVYLLANNTPNIIYELILGGILTATLVPLFTEHLEHDDRRATDAVVSVTLVALGVLTALALVAAPALMLLYGQNVDPDVDAAAFRRVGIALSLLFVPQVFFYGAMALGSALLNARRRFFAAAWAPVLNNLVVVAVLALAPTLVAGPLDLQEVDDDTALVLLIGLGTTAGIAAMALSLLPALWRAGVRFRFRPQLRHPAVRTAVKLSGWTLGYVIANQVAAQIVLLLAVSDQGTVRAYQTAFIFFQLPHGLLAVSLMTTFQPDLAQAFVRERWDVFHGRLLQGLRLLVVVVAPAAAGYLVLASLAVRLAPGTSYEDGSAIDVARAMIGFAPGLLGFSVYLFVLRGFYAVQDTRRPFWINLGENALNIVGALLLTTVTGLLIGLTTAYSVAYLVGAVAALAVLLRRLPAGFDVRGLARTVGRTLAACGAMGLAVVAVVVPVVGIDGDLLPYALVAAVPVGAVVYVLTALALGVGRDAGLAHRLPGPLRRLGPSA